MIFTQRWMSIPTSTSTTSTTSGRLQSKALILSKNVDQKSLKTEFSIAICRQLAIKNTVSSNFYPILSIVKSVFDCHLAGVST